jgi:acetone carboxylase gamma subunit
MALEYLYRYVLDVAFIAPPGKNEMLRIFKLHFYNTLYIMKAATRGSREMRITQLHPDTQWMQVWKNLHLAWMSEKIASMWYIVVHDIVPTNERLHEIWLVQSDRCGLCGP